MTPASAEPRSELATLLFGRLSLDSIPYHEPIILVTFAVAALAGISVLTWITRARAWGWLWRDWFCSIDHKKIGVMYMILGFVMLLRGFADAIMMRAQQAMALNNGGYLPPEHFDQIFSSHGTIMIFFMAMPFIMPNAANSAASTGETMPSSIRMGNAPCFERRW